MILFALVYAAPIITVFYTSLCDYTAFSAPAFQGIKNFITIFSDSDFICSIRNTLLWVVLQSTLHVGVGLAMAIVLRRKPKGWKIARTAYMIPNIIPTAATGVMFTLLLNPMFGIVKPVLDFFGVNYAMVPNLFGNSRYAFWTVTATWIFYSGFNTIIFLAEMGAVSKEIYEAAAIDGCGIYGCFFRIAGRPLYHLAPDEKCMRNLRNPCQCCHGFPVRYYLHDHKGRPGNVYPEPAYLPV